MDILASIQESISLNKNKSFIGKEISVLMEGTGDGISIGRSYRDAPEIDGLVFVEGDIPPGSMLPVRVTGALTHDLIARKVTQLA